MAGQRGLAMGAMLLLSASLLPMTACFLLTPSLAPRPTASALNVRQSTKTELVAPTGAVAAVRRKGAFQLTRCSLTATSLWEEAKGGDMDVFRSILPELNVITPAPDAQEVNIMQRVGTNKALLNKKLDILKQNDVELLVVTVASPTKLREFIAAADSLPAEYLYCDPTLSSYTVEGGGREEMGRRRWGGGVEEGQ
eukprot:755093-Hanusia_phi.AAC.2